LRFILLGYAIAPCYLEMDSAIKYSCRRLPDLDNTIRSFMRVWAQVKVTEDWAKGQLADEESKISIEHGSGDRSDG
jgi:hypothetical protein